ncbi:MAG: ABC transporter ATP-binding protein [Gammaproteobacteria bacterium]|nr:ABC transporter ATP-binding protein [Gammaproteobacteria bacterium]
MLVDDSASSVIAISATSLKKSFGGKVVVDGFSVEITRGQIFGLLGPNAAGKTTVIRMLCGIIDKDNGEVFINASDIAGARSRIGYVAQHFGQYEELTVWENLKFYAQMYNVENLQCLNDLLVDYELEPFRNQKAGTLSGGYQRRLALVCAIAHDPDVLFLDEPTAGIDPITRKLLWDEFYNLSTQGKTLFITTHYMEEAQRCDRLAFIDRGQVIASGTPVTIKQSLGDVIVYVATLAFKPEIHQALRADDNVLLVNQFGSELRIVVGVDYSSANLEKIIFQITDTPVTLTTGELNLEDVFIALTQHRELP